MLTIGELAERAGVATSTLRYYETTGLLAPDARVSGHRRYDETAMEKLTVIRFCQELGFTLAEIKALLTEPRGVRQKERWRTFVDEKVAELDATAAQLRAMKKILLASQDCDCVDVHECARLCAPT